MNQEPLSDPSEKRRETNPGSRQNALKFGFFSRKALLPGECWEDFVSFRQMVLEQWAPRNPLEQHLVDKYIAVAWRLQRLPEIEAFAFTRYGISKQGNQCGPGLALVASVQTDDILGQLSRYEATLRKSALKYLQLLVVMRKEATGEIGPRPGGAKVIDLAVESPGKNAEVGATRIIRKARSEPSDYTI